MVACFEYLFGDISNGSLFRIFVRRYIKWQFVSNICSGIYQMVACFKYLFGDISNGSLFRIFVRRYIKWQLVSNICPGMYQMAMNNSG